LQGKLDIAIVYLAVYYALTDVSAVISVTRSQPRSLRLKQSTARIRFFVN
jgi:hypothetical protein